MIIRTALPLHTLLRRFRGFPLTLLNLLAALRTVVRGPTITRLCSSPLTTKSKKPVESKGKMAAKKKLKKNPMSKIDRAIVNTIHTFSYTRHILSTSILGR